MNQEFQLVPQNLTNHLQAVGGLQTESEGLGA